MSKVRVQTGIYFLAEQFADCPFLFWETIPEQGLSQLLRNTAASPRFGMVSIYSAFPKCKH